MFIQYACWVAAGLLFAAYARKLEVNYSKAQRVWLSRRELGNASRVLHSNPNDLQRLGERHA